MKLAFDSCPALGWHGVGRYARCLLDALERSPRGEIVESRDPRHGDAFHSPWLERAPLRSPVPSVVTLHDLVPLKRPGDYLRTGLRFKLRYLAVQRATMVIVSTRTVADDAIHALDIPAARIEVIPEAAAPAFWRRSEEEVAAVRERYELPERYLLWVGSLRRPDPRKRVAARARADRSMPVVLVGPMSRWTRELTGVRVTGAVPDEEIAAIYSGAHAVVFPSEEEGFGLPPVEALACGVCGSAWVRSQVPDTSASGTLARFPLGSTGTDGGGGPFRRADVRQRRLDPGSRLRGGDRRPHHPAHPALPHARRAHGGDRRRQRHRVPRRQRRL